MHRDKQAHPVSLCWHRNTAIYLVAQCLLFTACDPPAEETTKDSEDLTIVVEADKSRIFEQEEALQQRRSAVEEERARLAQERLDIADKLSSLSKKDRKQRLKLEEERKRIDDEEQRLRNQNRKVEDERASLEKQKSALLQRIATMTRHSQGELSITQREALVGQREKALAEREKALALRDAKVVALEKQAIETLQQINELFAELKNSGGVAKTVVIAQASAPANVNRSSVLKLQRQIDQKMERKGILMDDLPPTAVQFNGQVSAALQSKDYSAAADALGQIEQIVDSIVIGKAFVAAKMVRLNRQRADKKLDEKRRQRVDSLLIELNDAATDGRYDRANKTANQIAALLR